MRIRILTIILASVLLATLGCNTHPATDKSSPADLASDKPRTTHPTPDKPWTNSLGMRFVPVPGTGLLFSTYETRRGDYAAFKKATGYGETTISVTLDGSSGPSWANPHYPQTDDHPVVEVSQTPPAKRVA